MVSSYLMSRKSGLRPSRRRSSSRTFREAENIGGLLDRLERLGREAVYRWKS